MRDLFDELLETIEKNAVDNKLTITNVEVFLKSWREEIKLENKYNLLSDLPSEDNDQGLKEGEVFSDLKLPLILRELKGLFINEAMDMANEYEYKILVVKRDGISIPTTMDFKFDRINVETVNGIITKVDGIG